MDDREVDGSDVVAQDEMETLRAELREAMQHQKAAVERMEETQAEVQALLERARKLLGRSES
jgi:hypothetical protein